MGVTRLAIPGLERRFAAAQEMQPAAAAPLLAADIGRDVKKIILAKVLRCLRAERELVEAHTVLDMHGVRWLNVARGARDVPAFLSARDAVMARRRVVRVGCAVAARATRRPAPLFTNPSPKTVARVLAGIPADRVVLNFSPISNRDAHWRDSSVFGTRAAVV